METRTKRPGRQPDEENQVARLHSLFLYTCPTFIICRLCYISASAREIYSHSGWGTGTREEIHFTR